MSFPDPAITDDEANDAIGRLEDRYTLGDLSPDHPVRDTRVDPIGYGRWYASYVVKRANSVPHEAAIQQVLTEIDVLVHGEPAPSPMPLEDLAHIHGAMWTARLNLPWGPRPGQDDNCICIDYFECFSPTDQGRIIQAYARERGYTHAPMGPIVDAGYHGQLPATDWRTDAGVYLAAAATLESAGVHVVHFLRPDRGVAGLDWSVADLDRELGPVFGSAQAQSVMRIVCLGWEPGPRYFYNNAWWVAMCQWMARAFPHALRLVHLVADCDAPVGQDDDVKGITNAQGWANVVPYLHGWLVQNAGYTNSGNPVPSDAFITEFTNQFNPAVHGSLQDRFRHGYAGWPTSSAWGDGQPLRVYAGEYAAYANYWQNWPERESRRLGQLARQAGADGALDGC